MAKKTNKFRSIVDDPDSGFTREEAIKEMVKSATTEQEIKETINYAHQNLKQVGVSSPVLNNEVKMEPDLELIVDGFNLSNSNDKDKIVTTQNVVLEDLKDPKPQVKEEKKEQQPQIIEEYEIVKDKKQNKNDLSADDIKIVAINFINRTVSRQPFFTSSIIADTASKLGEVKYSIAMIDVYKMTKDPFIDKRKKLNLLNQHKFKILNQIISSESKAKAILYLDINSGLESIPEGIKKKTDLVVFKSEKSNEYFTSAIIFINNRENIIKILAKENKLDDTTVTKIKEAGYTVTEILAI